MNRGWIRLYRKISDNELWTSEPFTRGQAWVDLIMIANYKDGYIYKRGNRLDITRGQVGWSQLKLAERWKWSRPKVKKFLTDLENDGFLLQQNSYISSLITIINYNEYQDGVTADLTAEKQQKSSRPYSKKKDKNDNKEKKKPIKHKYGIFKNVLLSDDEHEKLAYKFRDDILDKIKEMDEGIEMKNYKYASHYLAILKWERNAHKETGREFI